SSKCGYSGIAGAQMGDQSTMFSLWGGGTRPEEMPASPCDPEEGPQPGRGGISHRTINDRTGSIHSFPEEARTDGDNSSTETTRGFGWAGTADDHTRRVFGPRDEYPGA
ncbi:unnamed protein product, partial [Gordionus sp. m RMFG-2023]